MKALRRMGTRPRFSFQDYLLSDVSSEACKVSIGTLIPWKCDTPAALSTAKQDLERRMEALRSEGIPAESIYVDKKSGSTIDRRGLHQALDEARGGDVIVVQGAVRLE